MQKEKEEIHSCRSLHKQMQPNHQHQVHLNRKCKKNNKQPMPKKAGVMIMTHIGQMTGQVMVMNPTMDMMEITPKVIGTIGLILLPLRN